MYYFILVIVVVELRMFESSHLVHFINNILSYFTTMVVICSTELGWKFLVLSGSGGVFQVFVLRKINISIMV